MTEYAVHAKPRGKKKGGKKKKKKEKRFLAPVQPSLRDKKISITLLNSLFGRKIVF